MNMLGVSSFPEDATTISVWAFNSAGKLAGAYHCSAKDIQADDASVTMNLPSGSYDFIAWCGLKADAPLALGSENPSSKEDLSISLKLKEGSKDAKMFDSSLPSIYHGMASSIRIVKSTSDTQK
ncbi:MAG: FimB/Mfa2 family fimbrial subunit, partial [Muribaculaceae bacterium]|nr:FimB/Mfa2 family fimbrial subunit [Muribaculaceae bacterium]